jgi:glutathione S-transferase
LPNATSPLPCSRGFKNLLDPYGVIFVAGEQAHRGRRNRSRLQLEKVDLESHRTENGQDYYKANPKAYVPAIQRDGSMLTGNIAVLNWLADHTARKLFTRSPAAWSTTGWKNGPDSSPQSCTNRSGHSFRAAARRKSAKGRKRSESDWLMWTSSLPESDSMGERMTVADAYLFVILIWVKKNEFNLSHCPRLSAFSARMSQRPAVQHALIKEGLPRVA